MKVACSAQPFCSRIGRLSSQCGPCSLITTKNGISSRPADSRLNAYAGLFEAIFDRVVTVFQFLVVAGTPNTFSRKLFDSFVLPEPFGRKRKTSLSDIENSSPAFRAATILSV